MDTIKKIGVFFASVPLFFYEIFLGAGRRVQGTRPIRWVRGSAGTIARVGLLAAAVAVVGAVVWWSLAPPPTTQVVWVAATDLEAGTVVSRRSVEERGIPVRDAPAGAITDTRKIIGQLTAVPMARGEVFTTATFRRRHAPTPPTSIPAVEAPSVAAPSPPTSAGGAIVIRWAPTTPTPAPTPGSYTIEWNPQ